MNESLASVKPIIAHVLHRLGTGGLENGVVNLINHLPAHKYRHVVICMTDFTEFRNRIKKDDVQVYCLDKQPGKDYAVYLRLWKLLRELRPDILHTRNLSALEAQLPGFLAGVKRRVHGEHGRDIDDIDGTNPRYVLLRRLFIPIVQRYIPMSKDLEYWLVEHIKVPTRKIRQLYNGVDLTRFKLNSNKPFEKMPENFCPPGVVVIGTVGRQEVVKDPITLLHGFIQLVSRAPELSAKLRLILVGSGSLHDQLKHISQEAGVDSLVWFAGERSDVAELMQAFDIFVLPSINEGISNTILEAMATRLPVIATAVGGNPELVVENHTGFLVPKQQPDAIADVIQNYLNNPKLIAQHGEAGRQRCESLFSLTRMVSDYEHVYDELLES